MKLLMTFICLVCFVASVQAQQQLCVSTDKTTSLVFPFAITYVDRGNKFVLAQQVKDAPTVLLVKAATKDFKETNLSVITDDGSVYSFNVCYDNQPASWVHYLPVEKKATVAMYANGILDNPKAIKNLDDQKWESKAEITGIYVKDDNLYFQVLVDNQSPINYTIDLIRFYVSDKKKSKRTAVQEIPLRPLHTVGNISEIKAYSSTAMVFVLEKYTIPDGKYLAMQINEKNGGRHFLIRINNKQLMKAILLPDYK